MHPLDEPAKKQLKMSKKAAAEQEGCGNGVLDDLSTGPLFEGDEPVSLRLGPVLKSMRNTPPKWSTWDAVKIEDKVRNTPYNLCTWLWHLCGVVKITKAGKGSHTFLQKVKRRKLAVIVGGFSRLGKF